MKIRKVFAAISLGLCSSIAFAAGPLDGIYSCQFSSASGSDLVYIAINSNASTTVITVPSLAGGHYNGYAIGGAASDTAFSGTSEHGYSLTATARGVTGAKILSGSGTMYTTYGPVAFTANCSQII